MERTKPRLELSRIERDEVISIITELDQRFPDHDTFITWVEAKLNEAYEMGVRDTDGGDL